MSLPTVQMNCMDHLTSYLEVVTDATHELRYLILSSYREKTSRTGKRAECRSTRPT